jgi:hypothetical protein
VNWFFSDSCDPKARRIADKHYSRQKPGAARFVKPGSCLVLLNREINALWVTSNCIAEYVRHDWRGAWENSLFKNDSGMLASDLIKEAVSATKFYYGAPPALGIISFVNPEKVPGIWRRGKKIYGYCYLKAGWNHVGFTKGGLWVWQQLPDEMPPPVKPNHWQRSLFDD